MKKLILCLAAAVVSLTAAADEGMWLLPYLQKMNIGDMKAKGCQLTAEDIYSVNHGSLKDAIVIFGNGCTGEVVSPEGLVFTNHHCGYGSIQALSSVEHDYLKDGFWAMSNEEELPAPGLTVTFIRRIIDVTPEVLGNIPSIAKGEERSEMEDKNIEALYEKLRAENPGMTINIQPFFGGNQYFAFVMEVYRDIRLVGTPPTSIGKFGGETDNWMWPRHTGDFSIFRIYAGKDNRPAEYSEENVPYKAEEFLKVSLDGYKADDFTMIMGFPGSTERYMTSYEIDEMFQVSGPQRIDIRGARQDILKEDMAASDKVRIQYASKYANSSNYWKNTIGMLRGLKKLDVKALKEAQEAEFQAWAEQNTLPEEGFVDALGMIREAVNDNMAYTGPLQYLSEAMVRPEEMDAWVAEFRSWDLCDQCCINLFRYTSYAYGKVREYAASDEEFTRRAGFALLATLAVGDKRASDDDFRAFLPLIERGAEDSRVRIGKAVNWALRQIGKRSRGLYPDALALARRLAAKEGAAARRIGRDAVRELTLERIIARIK